MEQESQIKQYAGQLERASWLMVFFGMLTQISTKYSFPSYNVVLGFWGAYSAFSRHGRATFGFIMFSFFGMCLDIAFCSNNRYSSSVFTFCLVMLILCLFCKGYALYQASRFFTSIGGAYSLESSAMSTSMYDSLRTSEHEQNAGYYPPDEDHDAEAGKSLMMSGQSHSNSGVIGSGVTAVTTHRGSVPQKVPPPAEMMKNMQIHAAPTTGNSAVGLGMRNVAGNGANMGNVGGRISLTSSSIMQDPHPNGSDSAQENARVF